MICFSVANHASALNTPMAVSMCIDVQVKGMPTRAPWSGTDGLEQTLCYGEASHMVIERSLLFCTFKIMVPDVDLQRDVTSIKCFGLVWFHFSLNIWVVFSSRNTRELTVLFLLRTFFKPMEFMYRTGQTSPRPRFYKASLGRFGETYQQPTKTAHERQRIQAALRQDWNNMPQAFINKLVPLYSRGKC